MDIQRTGLLAILGVLTYVLFVQWNHYTDSTNEAIKASAPIQSSSSKSDLPDKVPQERELIQAPAAPLKPTVVGDHILISTPITDITIALTGGDIDQVLLKDYPISLKSPDNPIALLDTQSRTYVAQGLVGPDGQDTSPEGRPIYAAEQRHLRSQNQQTYLYKQRPKRA